jgi:UDP-N-acetylmuramoyl-L-alanyl-D-glutamate--2,6-diaminopimelate ligase
MNNTIQRLHKLSQPEAQTFDALGYSFEGSDTHIKNICDDSRHIQAGDTFLCLPRSGNQSDNYIHAAIEAGASSVVYVGSHTPKLSIPCLNLSSMHEAGLFLRRYFHTTSTNIQCIGVTGTDGKTSVTWMLREALARKYGQVWSSGTLGWVENQSSIHDLGNTTPSLLTMHRLLAAADKQGVFAWVMEVSSHGIEQERIAGIDFQAAIWTTLGHDHLQDHGGFEAYASIKQGFILDVGNKKGTVVYNQDQPAICTRLSDISFPTYPYANGLCAHKNKTHTLAWEQELPGLLRIACHEQEVVIEDIPSGRFHAENIAAVAHILRNHFDIPLAQLPGLLSNISAPPGRMQPVQTGRWQVFIDYAHTPEALQACLDAARFITRGRLLVVFGCGGERDHEKRPQMGAIASKYADIIWITSDNPRNEEPAIIIDDIKQGIQPTQAIELHLQENRQQAIAEAVAYMCIDDVLMIVGKGHETYMEIKNERMPWSDLAYARTCLQRKNKGEKICA